jgi:hypothetical protein
MGLVNWRSGQLAPVLALTFILVSPATAAEENQAQAGLSLELNRLEQNGAACRATLVAKNGFEASLDETAFELVMFDKAGLISLMTVFDFGALPAGKTRVQRFDLPQTSCPELTRILINGVSRCAGTGIDVSRCEANLSTNNRAGIEFGR